MLIEISNRKTGKTTRLIDEAVRYIKEYSKYHAIVFCCNDYLVEHIQNEIDKKIRETIFNKEQIKDLKSRIKVKSSTKINHRGLPYNIRKFYDEFGLCEYVEWYLSDGYYTTSYENYGHFLTLHKERQEVDN